MFDLMQRESCFSKLKNRYLSHGRRGLSLRQENTNIVEIGNETENVWIGLLFKGPTIANFKDSFIKMVARVVETNNCLHFPGADGAVNFIYFFTSSFSQ